MSTKNPEAFRLVEEVEDAALAFHKTVGMNRCLDAKRALLAYIEAKGARIAELEALAAGYDAARLEISSLHTQMEAVGAGGMEPLRKRCLHQISEPAREPLTTEEQMHKDLAALCKRIFNARVGKSCNNCDGGTYQSDNNGYGRFHRCNKCCYVPMWGEDGRELGAPIAAAKKGGQHGTE